MSPSISLSNDEAELPACEDRSPLSVEELDDVSRVTCDHVGGDVVFSDGVVVQAPSVLSSRSRSFGQGDQEPEFTYTLWNIGVYGIAAARARNDKTQSEWWGTPVALEKLSVLYGEDAPTI
jgi:hypothetical protein